jgi:hypothetical protein
LGGEVACALAGIGANVVIPDRNLDAAKGLRCGERGYGVLPY